MIDDSAHIICVGNVSAPREAILASLIWTIVAVLLILWLLGLGMHVGGSLIFLLLVLAIIGVVYNLLAGGMYGGRHHHHTTEVTEVEHRDA